VGRGLLPCYSLRKLCVSADWMLGCSSSAECWRRACRLGFLGSTTLGSKGMHGHTRHHSRQHLEALLPRQRGSLAPRLPPLEGWLYAIFMHGGLVTSVQLVRGSCW